MEKQLPKYMMPHVGIQLEKLPVTANGKVDRKNLVVPEQAAAKKMSSLKPLQKQKNS